MIFEDLKALAMKTTSASIADVYDPPHKMHMDGVFQQTHKRLFGQAVTLRSLPQRKDLMDEIGESINWKNSAWPFEAALGLCGPGKVLVIDASGYPEAAIGGDVKLTGLQAANAEGVVTDGAIRDREGFEEFDFACFCAGWTPQSGTARHLIGADLNVPISCGRVLVRPGDYLLGDATGVVVVPESEIKWVLRKAVIKEQLNDFVKEKILVEKANPGEYYPAPRHIKEEFSQATGIPLDEIP